MVENQELFAFMDAIRKQENAGGDYLKEHRPTITQTSNGTQQVQALGAYGILDINWDVWSKQAGYAGADWRIPVIQDIVAANKIQEYYNEFGSWELVAVAWYGGPGKARIAQNQGMDAIGDLKNMEDFGPDIKTYVNQVMSQYNVSLEKPQPNLSVEAYAQQRNQDKFFTTAYNPAGEIIDMPPTAYNPAGEIIDMPPQSLMKLNSNDITQTNRELIPANQDIAKYGAEILAALTPDRPELNIDTKGMV
jgi:hypothetical protein